MTGLKGLADSFLGNDQYKNVVKNAFRDTDPKKTDKDFDFSLLDSSDSSTATTKARTDRKSVV